MKGVKSNEIPSDMINHGALSLVNRYPANVPELIFAKKCPFQALNLHRCHKLISQWVSTKLEDQMHNRSNLKYMKKWTNFMFYA